MRITGPLHPRLHHVALAMCADGDLAQDLTQEALARAFEAFDSFQTNRPVMPWLVRILRNVYLNLVSCGRAKYEVATHQLGSNKSDPYRDVCAEEADPQAIVEHAELTAWLHEEVDRLDPPYRLAFLLCDQQDFSYEEAAEALAVPVGTVRSRLSRARDQVRRRLLARARRERLIASG